MKNGELKKSVSKTVAQIIKDARTDRGLSRYALAQMAGIDAGHLKRIEDGDLAIRVDALQKLCAAMRINITFPV